MVERWGRPSWSRVAAVTSMADCDDEDRTRRWSLARARRHLLPVYLLGLAFMGFAVPGALAGPPGLMAPPLRFGWIVALSAAYVFTAWAADFTERGRVRYVAGFLALVVASSVSWGWDFVFFGVYASLVVATMLPWRSALPVLVTWNLLLALTAWPAADVGALMIAALGLGIGISAGAGIAASRAQDALHQAERQMADLAVVAERERIARDLHDVLGHSLTAVSIKAGLAARLVERDTGAALRQITEIEDVARQALADVRATASSMRQVRLPTEVAGAGSILAAAGIAAELPDELPSLSDERSELFGYVVREAVTNVVRHSGASRCAITAGADWVAVIDDGQGLLDGFGGGSGLDGLRERLAVAGYQLDIDRPSTAGFRLEARPLGRQAPERPASIGRSV